MFFRSITTNVQCKQCYASKMKLWALENLDPEKTLPHAKFTFEVSVPSKPE